MQENIIKDTNQSSFSIQEIQKELTRILSSRQTEEAIQFFKEIEQKICTLSENQGFGKPSSPRTELVWIKNQLVREKQDQKDVEFINFVKDWQKKQSHTEPYKTFLQNLENKIFQLEAKLQNTTQNELQDLLDLPIPVRIFQIFQKLTQEDQPGLFGLLKEKRDQAVCSLYYSTNKTQEAIENSERINQYIDDYNTLLDHTAFLDAWMNGDENEMASSFIPFNNIKKINPTHIHKGETYSNDILLEYGGPKNTKTFKNFWERNGHLKKDFHYIKMVSEETSPKNELSSISIDHRSKLNFVLHGAAGYPNVQTDEYELGFRTFISYKELADEFVRNLTQEQLARLTNKEIQPHLRIRFITCHGGEGSTPDGKDSFCAQFHQYLKEKYGIYSEVVGSTSPLVVDQNGSGTKTIKYGYEKEYYQLCELGKRLYQEVNLLLEKGQSTTEKKITELEEKIDHVRLRINSLLIKQQPGSSVIYKWVKNEQTGEYEQSREDKLKGGVWRANVYQTLIHCIKHTHFPEEKGKRLYELLIDLDNLPNEEAMKDFFKDTLARTDDPYGINYRPFVSSLFFKFNDKRTETYEKLDALVKEFEEAQPQIGVVLN